MTAGYSPLNVATSAWGDDGDNNADIMLPATIPPLPRPPRVTSQPLSPADRPAASPSNLPVRIRGVTTNIHAIPDDTASAPAAPVDHSFHQPPSAWGDNGDDGDTVGTSFAVYRPPGGVIVTSEFCQPVSRNSEVGVMRAAGGDPRNRGEAPVGTAGTDKTVPAASADLRSWPPVRATPALWGHDDSDDDASDARALFSPPFRMGAAAAVMTRGVNPQPWSSSAAIAAAASAPKIYGDEYYEGRNDSGNCIDEAITVPLPLPAMAKFAPGRPPPPLSQERLSSWAYDEEEEKEKEDKNGNVDYNDNERKNNSSNCHSVNGGHTGEAFVKNGGVSSYSQVLGPTYDGAYSTPNGCRGYSGAAARFGNPSSSTPGSVFGRATHPSRAATTTGATTTPRTTVGSPWPTYTPFPEEQRTRGGEGVARVRGVERTDGDQNARRQGGGKEERGLSGHGRSGGDCRAGRDDGGKDGGVRVWTWWDNLKKTPGLVARLCACVLSVCALWITSLSVAGMLQSMQFR